MVFSLFNDKKPVIISLFKPFVAAFLIRPSAFDALLMLLIFLNRVKIKFCAAVNKENV